MFLRTGMGMLVLGAVLLAGCSSDHSKLSPAAGSDRVIRGSISYREHITLPAVADIDIWLNDTTPGYNIMMVTAETTIATAGRQVPIPFELRYDPSRIAAGHTYGLRATIRSGGEMLFTTNEATPVLVPDKSSKSDLMLVAAVRPPTDRAGTGFTGSAWRLEDLAGADVVPNAEATLEFPEAGKVVGKGTCNRCFRDGRDLGTNDDVRSNRRHEDGLSRREARGPGGEVLQGARGGRAVHARGRRADGIREGAGQTVALRTQNFLSGGHAADTCGGDS